MPSVFCEVLLNWREESKKEYCKERIKFSGRALTHALDYISRL
jgi:hypothetical protein